IAVDRAEGLVYTEEQNSRCPTTTTTLPIRLEGADFMAKLAPAAHLSFAQACAFLSLAPKDLARLREHGLLVCLEQGGRQLYPESALQLTRLLWDIGQEREWSLPTLAW